MLHHNKLNGRAINVEFTSRGKNSKERDAKIKLKNEKGSRFKWGSGVSVRKNRPVQKGKVKVKSTMK